MKNIMKVFALIVVLLSVNVSADEGQKDLTITRGDEDQEDFYQCTEIQYGTGEATQHGNYRMDVTVFSKCKRRFHVSANISYVGKDYNGERCGGSEERKPVMWVAPNETKDGSVLATRCWVVERAWIDDIVLRPRY